MTVSNFVQQSHRSELATLIVDNPLGRAEIAFFGAHVLSFTPHHDNRQRLWLSPHADLTGSKPIRGGIPICWPWFSDNHGQQQNQLPSHGFLRNQVWKHTKTEQQSERTVLTFEPGFCQAKGFDFSVRVSLTITVGRTLEVALNTTNKDRRQFNLGCALHSYFSVDNIAQTQLTGLSGPYRDKLNDWQETNTPSPYMFNQETDRIHLCQASETNIVCGNNNTSITHAGHDSVVVWNPWGTAASMSDMDAFGYKHMLCVETALTQGLILEPEHSHTLTQIIA